MGIEYSVSSERFNKDKCIELMQKVTSGSGAEINIKGCDYEFRFGKSSQMPDLNIQLSELGATIVYNGGSMKSWSVVGLFISLIAEWFGPVVFDEL